MRADRKTARHKIANASLVERLDDRFQTRQFHDPPFTLSPAPPSLCTRAVSKRAPDVQTVWSASIPPRRPPQRLRHLLAQRLRPDHLRPRPVAQHVHDELPRAAAAEARRTAASVRNSPAGSGRPPIPVCTAVRGEPRWRHWTQAQHRATRPPRNILSATNDACRSDRCRSAPPRHGDIHRASLCVLIRADFYRIGRLHPSQDQFPEFGANARVQVQCDREDPTTQAERTQCEPRQR